MKGLTREEEKIVSGIVLELAADCDVFAFGSRVRGTHRETSDLDLAFALPNGERLPFGRIGDIKEAFSESDIVFRVDVLDYNGVEPYFRKIIDNGRRKIYSPGAPD